MCCPGNTSSAFGALLMSLRVRVSESPKRGLYTLPSSKPTPRCLVCFNPRSESSLGRRQRLMIDVRIGVRRALSSQYRQQLHWWESVIMAQRLTLAMVFAFWSGLVRANCLCGMPVRSSGVISRSLARLCVLPTPFYLRSLLPFQQPAVQVLVSTLVCLVAVLAHVTFRPLHNAASHLMQTGLLLCLCIVALASVPLAEREEAALAASSESTRVKSADVANALTVTFGTVVPVVLLALAYAVPAVLLKWGPSSSAGAVIV